MARLITSLLTVYGHRLVVAQKLSPEQIHIAFNGDHSMTISWATKKGTSKTSTVKYALSPSELTMVATGTSVTYYGDEYHHHVELAELEAWNHILLSVR